MKLGGGRARLKGKRPTGGAGTSYLVRLYRHGEEPGGFIGVVESVEDGSRRAFANREELWAILARTGAGGEQDAPRPRKA